jgi:hypothetical protein
MDELLPALAQAVTSLAQAAANIPEASDIHVRPLCELVACAGSAAPRQPPQRQQRV